MPRGYKPKPIDESVDRFRNLTGDSFEEKRNEALKKRVKEDKNKDRIVVPIDFNPHMAPPGAVMKKHYKAMIRKNEELLKIFPSNPMAGLRQPKNLRRLLCSSKLQTPSDQTVKQGKTKYT